MGEENKSTLQQNETGAYFPVDILAQTVLLLHHHDAFDGF